MQEQSRSTSISGEAVNHPSHYNSNPSGVECITVVEHMSFNVGNAVKYLWRVGEKGDAIEDLRKAAWYVNREIERLSISIPPLTKAQVDELRAKWDKARDESPRI